MSFTPLTRVVAADNESALPRRSHRTALVLPLRWLLRRRLIIPTRSNATL